jgi:carboxymethylenebutenolidase
MAYEGMLAETVTITGHGGDQLEAYFARPLGTTSVPGVVVIHHMPGWDEWTKEVVRKLAYHGFAAIAPHLFAHWGPGSWDDLTAAARGAGGVSDEQLLVDVESSLAFLRALPYHNGKVGTIGFCSGGRHSYMCACKIPNLDAAVDCWGGNVIPEPDRITPRTPIPVIDMTKEMNCPLLGIFGNDDLNPDPVQVNRMEEELKKYGKNYEFHRYDGAGHGFFAVDRPGYRPVQAVDGWQKVWAFYDKYLMSATPAAAAAASTR